MRSMSTAFTKNIALIGGGHSHAIFLRKWGMNPLAGACLTLINPLPTAPYTGMLPGYVAGHYQQKELNIDLIKLARFAGARFVLGKASAIDRENRHVSVGNTRKIHYDIVSIDIGITTDLPNITGFSDFGTPAKPLDQFAASWDALLQDVNLNPRPLDLAVVGGGVAGIELALAMAHRFKANALPSPKISIIEKSSETLPTTNSKTRTALFTALADRNIVTLTSKNVTEVSQHEVVFDDGSSLPSDFTVGAAGARPYDWLEQTNLKLTNGFIDVDAFLRTPDDENIYAVGDCAHMTESPRPKAGVFAVRQAPILFHNIRASLMNSKPKPFRPQSEYLKLISTGEKSAIADKFGLSFSGPGLWRLKDHIDRKFMDQFTNYPAMESPPLNAHRVLDDASTAIPLDEMCGACGAKVPAKTLVGALSQIPPPKHKNILSGPGDDASILKIGETYQVITTDHLRAFTLDPWLLAKTATVHALGDIWAMGVQPHSLLSSITLSPSSEELQAEILKEIMAAISEVAKDAGADIIGGHTSVGAELSIGLTTIGLNDTPPITQSNAKPGDLLILTKPIGTGVVLAAEMALKAEGAWVSDTISHLIEPSANSSKILAGCANAMTDVTGFGLAGHLAIMMRASNTCGHLNHRSIPRLSGAVELAKQGIRSTLWQSNHEFVRELNCTGDPYADLLFDPQTSGGLLASVPADQADEVLRRLKEVAPHTTTIGRVSAGPANIILEEQSS